MYSPIWCERKGENVRGSRKRPTPEEASPPPPLFPAEAKSPLLCVACTLTRKLLNIFEKGGKEQQPQILCNYSTLLLWHGPLCWAGLGCLVFCCAGSDVALVQELQPPYALFLLPDTPLEMLQ